MNKAELISAVAAEAGISKNVAGAAFDAVCTSIAQALSDGKDVTLAGVGSLSVKDRAARTGRNPATGESVEIAAKKVPHFKASPSLKSRLN